MTASKTITADKKPQQPAKPGVPSVGEMPEASALNAAALAPVRLRDIVEQVQAATGAKRSDVKASVEATFAVLGVALGAGSSIVVPSFGKLRVVKSAEGVLTLKLRLADVSGATGLALADDQEDS